MAFNGWSGVGAERAHQSPQCNQTVHTPVSELQNCNPRDKKRSLGLLTAHDEAEEVVLTDQVSRYSDKKEEAEKTSRSWEGEVETLKYTAK